MNAQAGGSLIVEHGGPASPEELAALVLALTMISSERRVSRPSWQQAALREALGAAAAQSAADVAELSPGVPAVFV